jgi:ankyrin repeat protein
MNAINSWGCRPGTRRVFLLAGLSAVGASAFGGSFEDFFRAISRDDVRAIDRLVARGFDINTRDERDIPPLILALQLDSIKVANYLVAHADTEVRDVNAAGENALMIAALRGQIQMVDAILERHVPVNQPGWTPLHYAATHNGVAAALLVQRFLDRHAYIDAESPNGTTPLMMAARYGTEESVRVLLNADADASLKNQMGLTALDFAQLGARPGNVKLLTR